MYVYHNLQRIMKKYDTLWDRKHLRSARRTLVEAKGRRVSVVNDVSKSRSIAGHSWCPLAAICSHQRSTAASPEINYCHMGIYVWRHSLFVAARSASPDKISASAQNYSVSWSKLSCRSFLSMHIINVQNLLAIKLLFVLSSSSTCSCMMWRTCMYMCCTCTCGVYMYM